MVSGVDKNDRGRLSWFSYFAGHKDEDLKTHTHLT
jgi:hypothetical protein